MYKIKPAEKVAVTSEEPQVYVSSFQESNMFSKHAKLKLQTFTK